MEVLEFEPVSFWHDEPGDNGLVEPGICTRMFGLAAETGVPLEGAIQAPDLFTFCSKALDLAVQANMSQGMQIARHTGFDFGIRQAAIEASTEGAVLL